MLQVRVRTPQRPAAAAAAAVPAGRAVFISYAHADRADVLPFIERLQPLIERERLDLFFDAERLKAGDVWGDKLQAALQRCELFVLLATPACLASEFCIQRELLVALDRQRRGLCRIVPVVLRECDWKRKLLPDGSGELLSRFQILPAGGTAVAATEGAARDTVWMNIIDGLAEVLAEPAAAAPPARAAPPTAVPSLLPYLCDQQVPERAVRDLLLRWRAQAGPLVVMLRADATDCPDHFIDRIDERHLRKLLPKLTPGLELQRHGGLQWPTPQLGLRDGAALQGWFLDQIVERVTGDPYATEDELLQRLRDDAMNRLFIGGVPTAAADFIQASLQALGVCLGRLSQRLDKVRLAAVLWSEDPALKLMTADPPWECASADACIGLPAPLGRFGHDAVRDWALLDEVQRFAAIDRTELDAAFAGTPGELTMREFAAIAAPLLQRQAD
jgi:hypothetical protein